MYGEENNKTTVETTNNRVILKSVILFFFILDIGVHKVQRSFAALDRSDGLLYLGRERYDKKHI